MVAGNVHVHMRVQLVLDHLDDLPHGKAVGELVHAVIDLVQADGR